MKEVSKHRRWWPQHWFRFWLDLTGREREYRRTLSRYRKAGYSDGEAYKLARREFGFVGGAFERDRAESRLSVMQMAEQKMAEAVEAEAEAERKAWEEEVPAPATAPVWDASDPGYAVAVDWVLENMDTFIRQDAGKPSRVVNVSRMKRQAPNKKAIALMRWAAANPNKFMETAARVLAKPQQAASADEKYREADTDLDTLRRALREAEGASHDEPRANRVLEQPSRAPEAVSEPPQPARACQNVSLSREEPRYDSVA